MPSGRGSIPFSENGYDDKGFMGILDPADVVYDGSVRARAFVIYEIAGSFEHRERKIPAVFLIEIAELVMLADSSRLKTS